MEQLLYSSEVFKAAQKTPRGFTQVRKITLQDVLLFMIFRHLNTLNQEISAFFGDLNRERVSRQAMFKAMLKVNPAVFRVLIRAFYVQYVTTYEYYRLYDGYYLLAVDGSHFDLPSSDDARKTFGGQINKKGQDIHDVPTPQARTSMLYDVLNHVVLDCVVQPYDVSETDMLYQHLEACRDILRGKKVIILADRYYGSGELFLYCKKMGYSFVIRGKVNFYKELTKDIERSKVITLSFNDAWIKRMRNETCKQYAAEIGYQCDVRVIKNTFSYMFENKEESSDGIYYVSSELTSITDKEVVKIYHGRRWKIETGYFNLKSHLEAENLNSGIASIIECETYAKYVALVLGGVIFNEATAKAEHPSSGKTASSNEPPPVNSSETSASSVGRRSHFRSQNKYTYKINMKNVLDTMRLDPFVLRSISRALPLSNQELLDFQERFIPGCLLEKVAIREGRHIRRWNRWKGSLPRRKFRVDGRRNPPIDRCKTGNGYVTRK